MYEDKWRICLRILGLKVGTHWAACHDDTSQRQIASCARENFSEIFSPQQNSVAATCHKKSNQAEFVRLVVDFQKSPSSDLI